MMQQLGFGFDDGLAAGAAPIAAPRKKIAKAPRVAHLAAVDAARQPSLPVQALDTAVAMASPAAEVAHLAMVPTAPRPQQVALAVSATPAVSMEDLARQLEAHPDYRVLRRLVPKLFFDSLAQAPADVVRLLILDTETTGLNHGRDKIMELALLRVDVDRATGQPVGPVLVYDGLEDPGLPIPPEVRAITGIDDSMVQGQRLDTERIAALLDGVDLVVAHNAGFDRPFVEARLPAFATKAWACSFADIDWKSEGRGSAKLETLALGLGLFYDAHRAEMDCHALLAVLQAELPAGKVSGLARLLGVAPTLRYRLQATGAPFDAKDALKDRGYRWDATQKVWHTRLDNAALLQAEGEWLKAEVYGGRPARVQVETLDALVRYSGRAGVMDWRML